MSILRILEEHPIGSIRLEPALTVATATLIHDVLITMRAARIAYVLVVEQEDLVGIFTERDLLMHAVTPDGVPSSPVSEFMSHEPVTIEADQALSEVLGPMVDGRFRHLPIHDHRRGYIGVLTAHNLFQFIAELIPGTLLNLPPRPNQTLLAPEGA